MRLITKSIVYYLLVGLPLLILSGFLSYYAISTEVRDGIDESLAREKQNAASLTEKLKPASLFYLSYDSLSHIQPLSFHQGNGCGTRDSSLFDRIEKENNNYRILTCYYNYEGTTYRITIAKPLFEEEELIEGLVSSLFFIIGFLVAAFFIVNWQLSKTLWKPFNKTLQALSQYKLTQQSTLSLEKTTIYEFQLLNAELIKMTEKIHQDYLQQKEFTENASHELQTPLAIIKVTLDDLFQSTHLKEEELNHLQAIERSVNKLASLNKGLLLLTKIENHQFKDIREIDLQALISQLSDDYSSIYESKQIIIHKKFFDAKKIPIDPLLAELLFGNLIKNAFKHTPLNGNIKIEITDSYFNISNTGEELTLTKDELFDRFKKNDSSSDSLGLGLAIVKSIGQVYGYSVSYDYKQGRHFFNVNFK